MISFARCAFAFTIALSSVPASAAEPGAVGIDLSLHGGVDRYDAIGFKTALSSADFTDAQQLRDDSLSVGATVIARFGPFSAGALAELGRPGRANPTTAIGALGGLNLSLGRLQLDALAELGGHRYGDALHNPDVIVDSDRSDWLAYAGLRPGVALRFGERGAVLVGLWGFARWDLMTKDVAVTLANGTGDGTYELGGTQYGLALRVGFSL
jgi:hypothetical protein